MDLLRLRLDMADGGWEFCNNLTIAWGPGYRSRSSGLEPSIELGLPDQHKTHIKATNWRLF